MQNGQAEQRKMQIKDEFSRKIGRLAKSEAYAELCAEVYGYRGCWFNMTDRRQLDYIMNSIPISSDDELLDLGCGSGGLLRMLRDKYGCRAAGIDLLDEGATELRGSGIRYICGDVDELPKYAVMPTLTLSVDSLYFSADLDALIKYLAGISGNRLYLFYSQYLFGGEGDKTLLAADNTMLGKALTKAGAQFRTVDFSANERELYEATEGALHKLRDAFVAEGNGDLWEQKLQETRLGAELYKSGSAARYLYVVE